MSSSLISTWIKALPTALLAVDEIPMVSFTPTFPWQSFVEALTNRFELAKFSITPSSWQWREPTDFFNGIAGTPVLLSIGLAGYEGRITFVCDQTALNYLMGDFLHHQADFADVDASYQKGFLQFLAMEALDTLAGLKWEENTQCYILPESTLASEPLLSLDLTCELENHTIHARLFLDNTFRKSWKDRHQQPFSISRNPEMAQRISMPVSIRAGHTALSFENWKKVLPGDFLLLDICGLDPTYKSGTLTLAIHNFPFFQVKLNDDGTIVLVEQAIADQILSDEVTTVMADQQDDEEEDFEFDDGDFTFEEDEDEFKFDDDDHEIEKEEGVEDEAQASNTASPTSTKEAKSKKTAVSEEQSPEQKIEKQPAAKVDSVKDIPLTVIVEVGRFDMTVEKLMELQPGNLLNLNIHPENGVDLIVNGRRVGRGELLLLGESLGVKVTEV